MALSDLLKRIEELKERIHAKGKLPEEVLKKFQYKMRLDWNYHSNAMEGNSLTREETRSVMINNITLEGKPLQDVLDMRGHDEVITEILRMGKGEVNISEKRILQIHKAIIHEDDPAKRDVIGKWKTRNNYLTNYRGEKFDFTDHREVPTKMHELVNWLNATSDRIKKGEPVSPVLLAFEFHLRYVTIHPFLDGNGRTARIFMNIILIAFGYPPVIVKVDEKDQYGRYLADVQAYGGSPDLFYEFMCGLLIRSLEIEWDAIEGKDIEEKDDLEKEILVWKKQLPSNAIPPSIRSIKRVSELYEHGIKQTFELLMQRMNQFDDLFVRKSVQIRVRPGPPISSINNVSDAIARISEDLNISIEFRVGYEGFKNNGPKPFNMSYRLRFYFEPYSYSIHSSYGSTEELSYDQVINENMMNKIVNTDVKGFFENLKGRIEK